MKKAAPNESDKQDKEPKKSAASSRGSLNAKGQWIKADDLTRLQESLREAQETLDAIRNGEVDAVVVAGSNGSQIYSLAGAEQPYRVYVERMREGAVTVSPEGLILYCNQCFAEMVKTPLERAIGSDLRSYLAAESWETLSLIFGRSESVEQECRLDDGRLPVKLSASPLPLEDQMVMCLVVTDLTAQHEQERLRLAKEVAESASLAKDAFLATLSHELRTPLTPALVTAMALESDPGMPEYARQDLAMIRRNVELETRLIDDLLDLTRIANGKLELHKSHVDFHTLVSRAWEICDGGVKQKSIHVDLRLTARETTVNGDPVRLQQAIWNIIRNAVKFTPDHGRIRISTSNTSGKIRLTVTDNGIGFEPSAAASLFDAFEQTGRDITRKFGGLGLGLAISRSIVVGHAGSIHAESAGSHKGATFTIELPTEASQRQPSETPPPAESAAKSNPLRIMLVEDHEDTRHSMTRLLQRWGHEVVAAPTAKEALRLADKHSFHLVISDLGLPDETGLELMKKLRLKHRMTGIAVSGFGMEEDVAASEAAGFHHHLTKPIRAERLRELIERITIPES